MSQARLHMEGENSRLKQLVADNDIVPGLGSFLLNQTCKERMITR